MEPNGVASKPCRRQRGAQLIDYESKWWEALATLQSSLPTLFLTPDSQSGSRTTSLKIGCGAGITPRLKKFKRLFSGHWSSLPQLKYVESVVAPHLSFLAGQNSVGSDLYAGEI